MPTSAPNPNISPSVNLVEVLIKITEESILLENCSATFVDSEMIPSVCPDEYFWICFIASSSVSTIPTANFRSWNSVAK